MPGSEQLGTRSRSSSVSSSVSSTSRKAQRRQSRIAFEERQRYAAGHDGSGRDSFLKPPHNPGRPKTFFTELRGGCPISTPSQGQRKKRLTYHPRRRVARNALDDILDKSQAFGIKCNSQRLEGVGDLISGGPEHVIEEHKLPGKRETRRPQTASASYHRARTTMIRRNIDMFKVAGDPKKIRRDEFLQKCRERQSFASNYERHTMGRIYVEKKKSGIRTLH